ncbi:MAG: DUF6495 family protein [Putridiphycobacter sp.]
MKYRSLSQEELAEFEKEFIDFLVVNGITAEEWVKIKSDNLDKANFIIDKFSDVIFEGTMRKVEYLEFVSEKSMKCFQCLEKEIVLVGVDAATESGINFLKDLPSANFEHLEVYTSSKRYHKQREVELFDLIKKGAKISDGTRFKQLCLLL